MKMCSTVRLSKIRVIVNSSVERHLYNPSQVQDEHRLFVALGRNSTLSMEDCVLQTTFDCPSLVTLVVCAALEGGQVRDVLRPVCPLPNHSCSSISAMKVTYEPEPAYLSASLQSKHG
jgi:hypothetical protein